MKIRQSWKSLRKSALFGAALILVGAASAVLPQPARADTAGWALGVAGVALVGLLAHSSQPMPVAAAPIPVRAPPPSYAMPMARPMMAPRAPMMAPQMQARPPMMAAPVVYSSASAMPVSGVMHRGMYARPAGVPATAVGMAAPYGGLH